MFVETGVTTDSGPVPLFNALAADLSPYSLVALGQFARMADLMADLSPYSSMCAYSVPWRRLGGEGCNPLAVQ